MKPIGSNSPDLILRRPAKRSEAGRLEGWRLAPHSPAAILRDASLARCSSERENVSPDLILRSAHRRRCCAAGACVSKDEAADTFSRSQDEASRRLLRKLLRIRSAFLRWFETAQVRLLTMRISALKP